MEIGALQAADQAAASLPFTGPSSGTLQLRPSPLPTWRKRKLSKGDAGPGLPESESSRKSAEAVVRDHGAVRTVGLATSEAAEGAPEETCSISAEGDDSVSSSSCRDDVSGA
jgi:hypothetical protein